LGLADETGDFIQKMKDMGKEDRRRVGMARAALPGAELIPPSSNTGGKGTRAKSNKAGFDSLSGNISKRDQS
jgi:hypothetical protein